MNNPRSSALVIVLLLVIAPGWRVAAQDEIRFPRPRPREDEIGFVEKFALAQDREAVLGQLIPGSEEFYFYSALHYQNTRQREKLAALMAQWNKRYPNSEQRKMIENREALLTYETDPQATLKFLKERLNLQFNHQQEARDRRPNLPMALDQAKVAREVFLKASLTPNDDLGQLSEAALEELVRSKYALRPGQVRSLLARLKRPDLPNLVEVIAAELATKESRGFGEFEIHRALLPEQLDELAKRMPALYENQAFVTARMKKLSPGADTEVEFDAAEREAWLDRAWAYASKLSPAFNSLKANLLYQRLQSDRKKGVYNETPFKTYLQMPRRLGYVNPLYIEATVQKVGAIDLNADYSDAIRIAAPIHADEELVRDYFLHLFAATKPGAKGYNIDALLKPWLPYVRDTWLKPILAEAMITAGLGDAEQWASLLTPSAFQALKDRVDVDFTRNNPAVHQPADDVSVDLYLKNAPKLIVKIYEINALSYFLTNQKQLNTDLPLDGLVANKEATHDFSADPQGRNPLLRTLRTFKFPELKGKRGAWVIEFIGGGKSSRALIRKGQWSLLQRTGPAGEMLTVLDEQSAPVPDTMVWLEGRKYAVDEKTGYILVPFTQNPGTQTVILADAAGEFATLTNFEHHAENYRLDAQFHIEREQLLARKQATLSVHAALLLGDTQVSLDLLTDVVLTIGTTTLDGISVTSEVKAPKFDPAKAFTHSFTVPERLATLRITLNGKVPNLSKGGEKQDVNAGRTWEVNGIDRTELTSDGHLSKTSEGYVYELLGRNGEPLADQQVVFQFSHRDFQRTVYVALKTDDHGRIALGALAELSKVQARTPNNRERSWELRDFERTWPTALHAKVGEVIQVPVPLALETDAAALPRVVSLLEQRAGTFTADRRAAVKVAGGFLTIEGLAAGDYQLRIYEPGGPLDIPVRITVGTLVKNWLVGPNRSLEVREGAPLQIAEVTPATEGITVQLANWNKYTRVHVAATRFLPGVGLWNLARFARFTPAWNTPDRQPSLFAAGREIGDEYRYILERRYSKIFPGNELTRPGLLLNPWEVRSTDILAQALALGAKPSSTSGERRGNRVAAVTDAETPIKDLQDGNESPDLDFFAEGAPVLANLIPDEQGIVHIDRKALGDRQYVQILAENLTSAVWRTLTVAEVPAKLQDLRLIRNLDPAKAFTEKKTATVLTTGKSLTLADMLTSELEKYDSLTSVYALYLSLSGDAKLARFGWLLQWPTLKEEEKRAKYSEFACHELSFFLSRKDPDFFAKVVVPYLRNKKDKTFLDEYLLSADLHHWLEPWSYARLNIAERCLLAQRLPGEAAATTRHLRELWELLRPDLQRGDLLFDTALAGLALGDLNGDFKAERAKFEGTISFGSKLQNGDTANAVTSLYFKATPAPGMMATPKDSPVFIRGQAGGRAAGGGEDAEVREKNATKGVAMMKQQSEQAASESQLRRAELAPAAKAGDGTLALKDLYKMEVAEPFGLDASSETERERLLVRSFFRALGPTKEWAENNYYQLPIAQQNASLITVNQFWRDYAEWNGQAPFVSKNLAEASRGFPEMMLALAVLDLPFTAPKHETKADGGTYTLTAGGPLVAFHKEIQPAAVAKGNSELLVSQNFYKQGDRYREEGNERFDKYITDEFLTGLVYGANVVVTNPTSTPQKLDVLLQIPQGAIAVLGSKPTASKHVQLAPYTTQTFEYWFYFPLPSPGQPFPHYPVHVARNEENVGAAKAFNFNVVRQLTQEDKKSWDYLSQYGSEEDVFSYLEANNIERIPLERIAWRARKEGKFFQRLVALLATHHIYNDVIYSYAVVHNDTPALAEWLRHRDDFVSQCGPALKSKLLTIDPIERRTYEQLEYSPLVNQRAHRVGAENRIANPVLRGQYQALLRILAHEPALEPMDQMSVVYYLFLQDRVEEALARFHNIPADALPTRLQHDYFRCYAALYEENLGEARGLANQYADYPVDKWRKVFAEVAGQVDELTEGKPSVPPVKLENQPDRAVQQAELTATEPSFDFKVENKQVALTWKNLSAVTVNYYLMEPEFMFSSSPFVTEDSSRFSVIKPTKAAKVSLPAGQDTLDFPLPPEFAKANVLVEILGAGQRHAQAYHANSFKLALTENYGRLELREQTAGKPVSKAYVKVYARLHNGTVRFFKDGYTDLRGKFDYASLNSSEHPAVPAPMPRAAEDAKSGGLNYQMLRPDEIDQVERLSILVLHDAYGALVREVNPPSK